MGEARAPRPPRLMEERALRPPYKLLIEQKPEFRVRPNFFIPLSYCKNFPKYELQEAFKDLPEEQRTRLLHFSQAHQIGCF